MTGRFSLSMLIAMTCSLGVMAIRPAAGAMLNQTDPPAIFYGFGVDSSPDFSAQSVAGLEVSPINVEAGNIGGFAWDNPPGFSDNIASLTGTGAQLDNTPFFFTVNVLPGYTFTMQNWSVATLAFEAYHMQMDVDSVDAQGHHTPKATNWGDFGASSSNVHLYPSGDDVPASSVSLDGGQSYYFRLQPSNLSTGYYIDNLAIYGTMTQTPEPTTLALLGVGMATLLRRRRKATA